VRWRGEGGSGKKEEEESVEDEMGKEVY